MTPLVLGIGRSFTRTAQAVVIGPTTQIVLAPSAVSLPASSTTTVTGTAKDAANHATGAVVAYHSSNTAVATVNSSSGLVTWVGSGTTNITATYLAITSNTVVVTAAAGPTVQIASVPATLTLAHGVTGSALAGTAEDTNTVTTADRKYWHSSDNTIVTVDPDTGVPTGVAAGSATITVNFVAPVTSDEPVYNAGTDELVLSDDFSNDLYYADVTTMADRPTDYTLRLVPQPSPLFNAGNAINTSFNKIVTPGRSGAVRALRGHNFGSGLGDGSIWATYPNFESVAGADPLKATVIQWWTRITSTVDYVGDWRKYIMMFHPGAVGRIQFDTHGNSPWLLTGIPPEANSTFWQVHDQSFGVEGNLQARGPYMGSFNNEGWYKNTVLYQAHTPNAGTIMIGVKTADVTFASDQAGVLANGDVIALKRTDGSSASASGFLLSGFDGHTGGHVVRTAAAITKTYSGAMSAMANVTRCGVFDTSQAGEPTMVNGVVLAVNDVVGASFGQQTMTNFDGSFTCDLTKPTLDSDIGPYNFDFGGMAFSSKNDGIARLWINGRKVLDLSQAAVGTSPSDGWKKWCTAEDLGSLATNAGVFWVLLGGEQTSASPENDMDFADVLWYRTARRT